MKQEPTKSIYIFKGDSSNFQGNQELILELKTELDTSKLRAVFVLFDYVQEFYPIPEDKKLRLVFSKFDTAKFPLGSHNGTLYLTDANGSKRTVSDTLNIIVTNSVESAYDRDDAQSISVIVRGDDVVREINGIKPDVDGRLFIDVDGAVHSVNGVYPDSNKNIEIDVSGSVHTVNGVLPDENGNIDIDTSIGDVRSVNHIKPTKGNVDVDTGVMTINNTTPEEGNVNIPIVSLSDAGGGKYKITIQ